MRDVNAVFTKRTQPLALLLLLLLAGCFSTPREDASLAELLIELADMPANWYVVSSGQAPDNMRQEAGVDIWFNGLTNEDLHVASHRVYRYRNQSQAAREFRRQLPIQFNSSSIASMTPWQPPSELPYMSQVADQYHFACHIAVIMDKKLICKAIGQYGRYLVIFHTHVVAGYMSYSDIEAILETIDSRMATYEGK
jgi:hypothetical protein